MKLEKMKITRLTEFGELFMKYYIKQVTASKYNESMEIVANQPYSNQREFNISKTQIITYCDKSLEFLNSARNYIQKMINLVDKEDEIYEKFLKLLLKTNQALNQHNTLYKEYINLVEFGGISDPLRAEELEKHMSIKIEDANSVNSEIDELELKYPEKFEPLGRIVDGLENEINKLEDHLKNETK